MTEISLRSIPQLFSFSSQESSSQFTDDDDRASDEPGGGSDEGEGGGIGAGEGEEIGAGEGIVAGEGEGIVAGGGGGGPGGGGAGKRPDLDEPLFPGLPTTKFECLMMCFHLMIRNGLSYIGLTHLLKMINSIFGELVVPETVTVFERIFTGSLQAEIHFYCGNCPTYLGEKFFLFPPDITETECPSCSTKHTLADLEKSSFFMYIPIGQQLKSYFETTANISELLKHRFESATNDDIISDIFDGSVYKSLMAEGGFLSDFRNIGISFDCDGAPVFKSVKNSLWPIQFFIQDLPIKERFNTWNYMVAGLWFGKEEPDMSIFLMPFILELQKLYYEGFTWTDPSSGISHVSKVMVLCCCTDTMGKPRLQSLKQFNGFYGCPYCLNIGVMIPDHPPVRYLLDVNPVIGDDNEPSYTVKGKDPKTGEIKLFDVVDRTDSGIREDMENSANSDDVNYSQRGEG